MLALHDTERSGHMPPCSTILLNRTSARPYMGHGRSKLDHDRTRDKSIWYAMMPCSVLAMLLVVLMCSVGCRSTGDRNEGQASRRYAFQTSIGTVSWKFEDAGWDVIHIPRERGGILEILSASHKDGRYLDICIYRSPFYATAEWIVTDTEAKIVDVVKSSDGALTFKIIRLENGTTLAKEDSKHITVDRVGGPAGAPPVNSWTKGIPYKVLRSMQVEE